jgi:type IV pilus assembly protein PilC
MMPRLINLLLLAAVVVGTTIYLLALIVMLSEGENLDEMIVLGVLWVVVVAVGVAVVRERRAQRRAAALLGHLEQAVQLNLPLPRVLRAAEQQEARRWLRQSYAHLRTLLEAGQPLAEALAVTAPRLGRRAIKAISRAERSGRLAAILPRLVRRHVPPSDSSGPAFYSSYPIIVLTVLVAVMGLTMVFVMPKFQQIFHDFGVTLPALTRQSIAIMRVVGDGIWLILLVLVLILLGWIVSGPQRPIWGSGYVVLPLRTRLWWSLPLVGFVHRNRVLSEALGAMASAMHAGFPATDALAEARATCPDAVIRRRLHQWHERISHGQPLGNAAREARLPPLVAGMLSSARDAEDQHEVLNFLSRYYGSRFSPGVALAHGAVVPVTVLLLGFAVAWAALTLFLPLVSLIDAVSPNWSTL